MIDLYFRYCENGLLYLICKVYGKFFENLVGVYMVQVLQGLQYLYDQGVIYRDIKGVNILMIKDGMVKLVDFGVLMSQFMMGNDKEVQVVGILYWMVLEIIQLLGVMLVSDIWSVGCMVIELLQGKLLYYNLVVMLVLFVIVNDDYFFLFEGVFLVSFFLGQDRFWGRVNDLGGIGCEGFFYGLFLERFEFEGYGEEVDEVFVDYWVQEDGCFGVEIIC